MATLNIGGKRVKVDDSFLSLSPEQQQLLESRIFGTEEICRWFRVQPHKIQHLLHATFSNIEQQSLELTRLDRSSIYGGVHLYCLRPL